MDLEEHESLVNMLVKGKKLAEELAGHLRGTSPSVNEIHVDRMLASYGEALNLLTRPEPQGQCQSVISSASDTSAPSVSLCNVTPSKDSSIGSLKRKSMEEDLQNLKIKMSQERRLGEVYASSNMDALEKVLAEFHQNLLVPTESDQQEKCQPVESSLSDPSGSSSSVLNATPSKESSSRYERRSRQNIQTLRTAICQETTLDDGYSWRKYGQKEILGSRYPRAYYRCTYRHIQGCLAVKQVQRLDGDPTIFEVLYRGVHTCQAGALASKPNSEEKQE